MLLCSDCEKSFVLWRRALVIDENNDCCDEMRINTTRRGVNCVSSQHRTSSGKVFAVEGN